MMDNSSPSYSHKLSGNAARLLLQFDERIRTVYDAVSTSKADEYISYQFPGTSNPFVHADRRTLELYVLLDIPRSRITRVIDPHGLYETCKAFPKFEAGRVPNNRVMILCNSINRIEYIMKLIRRISVRV